MARIRDPLDIATRVCARVREGRVARAAASAILLLVLAASPAVAQKRCVRGIPCGNTCIAATKTCRIGTGSATTSPSSARAAVTIPEGMHFVASTRGRTYYWVGCNGWKSLAPANLRFFRTAADARATGLNVSTQSGCAGPAAVQGTADTSAAPPAPIAARARPVGVAATATTTATCTVARVIDGDTLDCAGGPRVRLLLIDAPEMNQGPFGAVAKLQLEALAPAGTVLSLSSDIEKQDRYGRTLAYLYLDDGRMLNEELLRAGVAVVSVYPPNVQHVDRLRAAVDSARAQKRGLWATAAFECLPGDYRAVRCEA